MDTGSEEGFASFCAALEPPLQDYCRPPERQLDAPLGGLEIQAVQLLRAAWRDTSLQVGSPWGCGTRLLGGGVEGAWMRWDWVTENCTAQHSTQHSTAQQS
jgi:hypothetical protein